MAMDSADNGYGNQSYINKASLSSCNEIYQHNIASRGDGHYWINTTQGLHEVKCKMGLQCGGVEGGWMQVVDVNMAHDESCPGPRRMITEILCRCSECWV